RANRKSPDKWMAGHIRFLDRLRFRNHLAPFSGKTDKAASRPGHLNIFRFEQQPDFSRLQWPFQQKSPIDSRDNLAAPFLGGTKRFIVLAKVVGISVRKLQA